MHGLPRDPDMQELLALLLRGPRKYPERRDAGCRHGLGHAIGVTDFNVTNRVPGKLVTGSRTTVQQDLVAL
jgi:hypothetical protein